MLERRISREEVLDVLEVGVIIQRYDDDKPFPSVLLLGFPATRPIHVVASFDGDNFIVFLVTAYGPDLSIFQDGFKTTKT